MSTKPYNNTSPNSLEQDFAGEKLPSHRFFFCLFFFLIVRYNEGERKVSKNCKSNYFKSPIANNIVKSFVFFT